MSTKISAHRSEPADRLRWLERYARHKALQIDEAVGPEQAIKAQFSAAAWRIVCRSPKSAFHPILKNCRLGFADLVSYAQGLADHGFRVAPLGEVLCAFVRSSFAFFDQAPAVPVTREDLNVMRLANAQGRLNAKQLHLIQQWIYAGHKISAGMRWVSILKRADAWQARQLAQISQTRWTFACDSLNWFGLDVAPLRSAVDLWDDGQAMSSCLYRLRTECDSSSASRFFSIRRGGRRYATLELSWTTEAAEAGLCGRYKLRDCRLSANRLPPDELVALLSGFASHYQQLAQSQGLLPQASKTVSKLWEGVAWQATPAKRQLLPAQISG